VMVDRFVRFAYGRRSHRAARALVLAAVLGAVPDPARAQDRGCLRVAGTPFDAVVSVRGLAAPEGSTGLLRGGASTLRMTGCPGALAPDTSAGFGLLPVVVRTHWRSAYPFDRNDGALWTGRGLSQAVAL